MTSAIPLRRQEDQRQHLLDALPDATAVVDRFGVITAVNQAWKMFAVDNQGVPATTGVGVNYLQVCDHAAAAGLADGAAAAKGLRAVLTGESVQRDVEYECSSPLLQRWYVLRVTPITGVIRGALLSHLNVTAQRAAEQELRHRASHDPLTGLANRPLLLERLAEALTPRSGRRQGCDVGLLLLDLDRFTCVNDTYGHAAGDQVLTVTSHRLRGAVRGQDTVARLGGDEFVVLAPRLTRPALAVLARRLTCALAPPQVIHGKSLHISASIGAHLAAAGSDAADTLAAADAAMYHEKNTILLPRRPARPAPRPPDR